MWEVSDGIVETAISIAVMVNQEAVDEFGKMEGFDEHVEGLEKRQLEYLSALVLGMKMYRDLVDEADDEAEFGRMCVESLVSVSLGMAMRLGQDVEDFINGASDEKVQVSENEFTDGSELSDEMVRFVHEKTGLSVERIREARFAVYNKTSGSVIDPSRLKVEGDALSIEDEAPVKEEAENASEINIDSLLKKADEVHKSI